LTADKSQTVVDKEAPGIIETWKAVVKLYKAGKGKIRAIGVSNFTKKHLEMIIEATGVVPAVCQIEAHPGLQQVELEGQLLLLHTGDIKWITGILTLPTLV
jgi:L-glyceraldehyde reductase